MSTSFNTGFINGDPIDASHVTQFADPVQDLESGKAWYRADTGVANAHVVNFPDPTENGIDASSIDDGQMIHFKASGTNTGAVTLTLNGTSSTSTTLAIKKNGSTDLDAGDIQIGQMVAVMYNGDGGGRFEMATGTVGQNGAAGPTGPTGPTGPAGPNGSIDLLTDVDITGSPGADEFLKHDGTSFTNVSAADVRTALNVPTTVDLSGKADLIHTHDATDIGGGSVDNTEFGYLDGVTSGIQAQLDAKESAVSGALQDIKSLDGSLASGDMLYVDGAGDVNRLPKGADGEFLSLDSGLPSWEALQSADIPALWVTSNDVSTNYNTDGTWTPVKWDMDASSQGIGISHDKTTNNTRMTFSAAGTYILDAQLSVTTSLERGNLRVRFRLNGSTFFGPEGAGGYMRNLDSHNNASTEVKAMLIASPGDYVELCTTREAKVGTINLNAGQSMLRAILLQSSSVNVDVDTLDLGSSGIAPTKGRILVGDGTTWQGLASPSTDDILTGDTAEAAGVKWAAPGVTPVSQGGTGISSISSNRLLGSGSSPDSIQQVSIGSGLSLSGGVLSNSSTGMVGSGFKYRNTGSVYITGDYDLTWTAGGTTSSHLTETTNGFQANQDGLYLISYGAGGITITTGTYEVLIKRAGTWITSGMTVDGAKTGSPNNWWASGTTVLELTSGQEIRVMVRALASNLYFYKGYLNIAYLGTP